MKKIIFLIVSVFSLFFFTNSYAGCEPLYAAHSATTAELSQALTEQLQETRKQEPNTKSWAACQEAITSFNDIIAVIGRGSIEFKALKAAIIALIKRIIDKAISSVCSVILTTIQGAYDQVSNSIIGGVYEVGVDGDYDVISGRGEVNPYIKKK